MKKLSKVDFKLGACTKEERDKLYQEINDKLPTIEERLNGFNPSNQEDKEFKAKLCDVLESLKTIISQKPDYLLSKAKFEYLKQCLEI